MCSTRSGVSTVAPPRAPRPSRRRRGRHGPQAQHTIGRVTGGAARKNATRNRSVATATPWVAAVASSSGSRAQAGTCFGRPVAVARGEAQVRLQRVVADVEQPAGLTFVAAAAFEDEPGVAAAPGAHRLGAHQRRCQHLGVLAPQTCGGRSSSSMRSDSASATARSMTRSSSRTLPGQRWSRSASSAPSDSEQLAHVPVPRQEVARQLG